MSPRQRDLPIGIFDSGVGGLTVLKAVRERLPHESVVYLGDTARLPYGTKSAAAVSTYAVQAARALVATGIKALVVADNTSSAHALETLRAEFPGLPVIGVIEPGARLQAVSSRNMYSEHGLEALMRPDSGQVCQSLMVVSNWMPGSAQAWTSW